MLVDVSIRNKTVVRSAAKFRKAWSRWIDADAAVEDEVHGIGGIAGLHDDVAGLDLEALAAADQLVGIVLAVENPVNQSRRLACSCSSP